MGTDIHIILEKKVGDQKWEETRNISQWRYDDLARRLKYFTENEEVEMEAISDGTIDEIKSMMKEAENNAFWIDASRNYLFFTLLSDIRNYRVIESLLTKRPMLIDKTNNELTTIEGKEYRNFSETSKEILYDEDGDYHTPSVISGDEIDDILKHIQDVNNNGQISKDEFVISKKYYEENFKDPVNKYVNKGYNPSELRFIIAYDN